MTRESFDNWRPDDAETEDKFYVTNPVKAVYRITLVCIKGQSRCLYSLVEKEILRRNKAERPNAALQIKCWMDGGVDASVKKPL